MHTAQTAAVMRSDLGVEEKLLRVGFPEHVQFSEHGEPPKGLVLPSVRANATAEAATRPVLTLHSPHAMTAMWYALPSSGLPILTTSLIGNPSARFASITS